MRAFLNVVAPLFFIVCLVQAAGAAAIDYTAEHLSDNRWQYNYSITNGLETTNIGGFIVYFEYDLYMDLELKFSGDTVQGNRLDGWQGDGEIYVYMPQSFMGINENGELVVTMGTDAWLMPGDTLGGFSVSFEWLGSGDPGSQLFKIFDDSFMCLPDDLHTQEYVSSQTRGDLTDAPEPQTFVLLGAGLAGLVAYRLRNTRHKAGRHQGNS